MGHTKKIFVLTFLLFVLSFPLKAKEKNLLDRVYVFASKIENSTWKIWLFNNGNSLINISSYNVTYTADNIMTFPQVIDTGSRIEEGFSVKPGEFFYITRDELGEGSSRLFPESIMILVGEKYYKIGIIVETDPRATPK